MILFRWDEAKSASNKRKHGIAFSDAIHVFEDPFALSEPDRNVEGEVRWQTIGLVGNVVIILVAHTIEDESDHGSFASSPHAELHAGSGNVMSRTVTKTFHESKLTPRRKRELAGLATGPDSEIDLSDIPELTDKFWRNAVRNPLYRPVKKQLTVRLDADVLAWLRKNGKGYQTRLNMLLRAAMLQDSAPRRKRAN